jgi:hypothetical protein
MSAEQIYDFEGIIEPAVCNVLTSASLIAIHSGSDPKFQQAIPRVEITIAVGSGAQRPWAIDATEANQRETAWNAQLRLDLITPSDIIVHRAYRATIRSQMAILPTTINNTTGMERHKIQRITDAGTSPCQSPQDGIYQTTLLYDLQFSVQSYAWADLEAET